MDADIEVILTSFIVAGSWMEIDPDGVVIDQLPMGFIFFAKLRCISIIVTVICQYDFDIVVRILPVNQKRYACVDAVAYSPGR